MEAVNAVSLLASPVPRSKLFHVFFSFHRISHASPRRHGRSGRHPSQLCPRQALRAGAARPGGGQGRCLRSRRGHGGDGAGRGGRRLRGVLRRGSPRGARQRAEGAHPAAGRLLRRGGLAQRCRAEPGRGGAGPRTGRTSPDAARRAPVERLAQAGLRHAPAGLFRRRDPPLGRAPARRAAGRRSQPDQPPGLRGRTGP